MQDEQIIDLYWSRSEDAISATADKYGRYCYYIAYNILHNEEDSKECVNDTYFKAWQSIPPNRPWDFSTFLGKITRNLALNKCKLSQTKKRGGGELPLILDEVQNFVPDSQNPDSILDAFILTQAFNTFLNMLPLEARNIFVRRYWFFSSIKEIAADFSISESKVKISLMRSRAKLKKILQKEGIHI